jgi:hypothetical protein
MPKPSYACDPFLASRIPRQPAVLLEQHLLELLLLLRWHQDLGC